MPYEPGQAKRARALEPLRVDIDEHLRVHLVAWIVDILKEGYDSRATNLLLSYMDMRMSLHTLPRAHCMQALVVGCKSDEFCLTVIEFLLDGYAGSEAREHLKDILRAAHSAYTVNEAGDGLAWVATPEAVKQIEKVLEASDPGPAHWLSEAWNDAYAMEPRPGPSYSASVRAVEGALREIVIPKNGKATITQIINALRDGRQKFLFELADVRGAAAGANEPEIDSIEVVIATLRALAYGERIRHGESGDVNLNTVDEARTALQLAVSLVQFANTGALRLK